MDEMEGGRNASTACLVRKVAHVRIRVCQIAYYARKRKAKKTTVVSFIVIAARLNLSVLIIGEPGTGKELVARGIHKASGRAGKPFVDVNCAAINPNLIESELFGHEKGAFTRALARKPGRFERASGGTLFLDEIGDLPQQSQAMLLRVLQERKLERVGGTEAIKIDIRLVAATNHDLRREVDELLMYHKRPIMPCAVVSSRSQKKWLAASLSSNLRLMRAWVSLNVFCRTSLGLLVRDREVGGSNPSAPINRIKKLRLPFLEAFLFTTLSTTLSIPQKTESIVSSMGPTAPVFGNS
ncbi:MAG TPA: sigma-54 factor interaction domain-containing protein, partial [Blastocatellia bacterium]